ncbi:MAG: hypothetical protein AAF092_17760 [Pseudomonadota bacterium]
MKPLATALVLSLTLAASSASALIDPFFPVLTFPTVETDSSTQVPLLPVLPEGDQ